MSCDFLCVRWILPVIGEQAGPLVAHPLDVIGQQHGVILVVVTAEVNLGLLFWHGLINVDCVHPVCLGGIPPAITTTLGTEMMNKMIAFKSPSAF